MFTTCSKVLSIIGNLQIFFKLAYLCIFFWTPCTCSCRYYLTNYLAFMSAGLQNKIPLKLLRNNVILTWWLDRRKSTRPVYTATVVATAVVFLPSRRWILLYDQQLVHKPWVNVFSVYASLLLCPISRPPQAEAFSRPSAQSVTTQRCVYVSASGQSVCVSSEQFLSTLF